MTVNATAIDTRIDSAYEKASGSKNEPVTLSRKNTGTTASTLINVA